MTGITTTKDNKPISDELLTWKSSLATCAVEGNTYAQEQLELWSTDRDAFVREYNRQQEIRDSER